MDINLQSDASITEMLMFGNMWSTDEDELIVKIASHTAAAVAESWSLYEDKIPYHTSALSGYAWVQELISGHPDHIHCELGVHIHVFDKLIWTLLKLRYTNSKYVMLEEQLSNFLYTCITGLTTCHVGKQFQ